MSVTAGVSSGAIAIRDKLRGKIEQTKVKRYWIGKAPEWADSGEADDDVRTASKPCVEVIAGGDDPRLRRVAASRIDDLEETRASHRRIRQDEEGEENRRECDNDDALEERRLRIKERMLQREKDEAAAALVCDEGEDEVDEEEEESEWESNSDDELTVIATMVRPVFVNVSERDTMVERERLEEEERAHEECKRRRLEELKDESRQIVIAEIKKYEEIEKNLDEVEADIADVDTDEEVNGAEEYEAWKVREFARIKRDRKDQEAMLKEMEEEVETVKDTTLGEVEIEQKEGGERGNSKPLRSSKRKWRFMQKYYHKGAFFQSDGDDLAATAGSDNIYTRDFSAPTGEDKMNKAILPKFMQVKHFGRSGRTKWTHLVNEDTTDMKNPWTYNDLLRAKYEAKMAAMDAPIAKPKGSKKLKDSLGSV